MSQPICIIGAGPAGLVCALSLAQRGILPLIFEQSSSRKPQSRATGLQKDTLAILDQLGVGHAIRARATPLYGSVIMYDRQEVRRLQFADPASSVCENLSLNQSEIESVIAETIDKKTGIKVAWNTSVHMKGTDIYVPQTDHKIKAALIISADGRNSSIRQQLGIKTEETQDSEISFGCDAVLDVPEMLDHSFMYQMFSSEGRITFVPLPGKGKYKISGTFKKSTDRLEVPSKEALENIIQNRSGIKVGMMKDVFLYRLGSVKAESFGKGNAILAGDAAQTFYPNGGFGLNTAIQQAHSLAQTIAEHPDDCLNEYTKIWAHTVEERFRVMNALRAIHPA